MVFSVMPPSWKLNNGFNFFYRVKPDKKQVKHFKLNYQIHNYEIENLPYRLFKNAICFDL